MGPSPLLLATAERVGNPNIAQLPRRPAYSSASRDTMLFNNESRVEQDPDRENRLAMERRIGLPECE
jgi:carboxylesterase type B